jgi:hypothetical protein
VAGYGVTRIAPEQLEDEPEALAVDLRALFEEGRERAHLSQYKRP